MRVNTSAAAALAPPGPASAGESARPPVPSARPSAPSARPSAPTEAKANPFRIAQFSQWNMFDTKDDPTTSKDMVFKPEEYKARITKMARFVSSQLGNPDVISLTEIENQKVLDDLLAQPEMKGYKSVLGTRNDFRGIRSAVLYRSDRLEVTKVEEFNPSVKVPGKAGVDPTLLYARAPLAVDFRFTGAAQAANGVQNLTVIANHFKSKIDDRPAHEARRIAQGQYLGGYVDARRAASPQTPVIAIGDFNATPDDGAYKKLARREDGTYRFTDAATKIPEADRYTYDYRGEKNLLDHVFYTKDLKKALVGSSIPHVNTSKGSSKLRLDPSVPDGHSDHDPLLAEFDLSKVAQQAK